MNLPAPTFSKNDRLANILIWSVSAVVFVVVVLLHELKIEVDLGFDVHIFAQLNAFINGFVAILLIAGLVLIKAKKYVLHKK